jgi:hypothetical protein
LLDVAPHKLSLKGGQDAATSPLRASLTEYQDKANPQSVYDGLVAAPHVTGLTATLFIVVATSIAYARLAQPS